MLTKEDLYNLLECITRAEQKTMGSVTKAEYESLVRLCQDLECSSSFTEYFARKAVTTD